MIDDRIGTWPVESRTAVCVTAWTKSANGFRKGRPATINWEPGTLTNAEVLGNRYGRHYDSKCVFLVMLSKGGRPP